MKEPLLGQFVKLVEDEGYVIPAKICRVITSSSAKLALRLWLSTRPLEKKNLLEWRDISIPWLCDDASMEAWSKQAAQMRALPPTSHEDDIVNWNLTWCSCLLNDSTNLLCKHDDSLESLEPLFQVCCTFLDARLDEFPRAAKWRRQADERVLLAIESVTSVFRGIVACISPVPMDRLAVIADVDFFLPRGMADTASSKRKAPGENEASMQDINVAAKVIQNNVAQSKLWRQLRASYKASQAVDQELGPALSAMLAKLAAINQDTLAETMPEAICFMQMMLSGPKKVREGGAKPLIDKLACLITESGELLICETGPDASSIDEALMEAEELIRVAQKIPGMEGMVTKLTAFKTIVQEKNVSATLATLVKQDHFSPDCATKLVQVLRATDGTDLGPVLSDELSQARVRVCEDMVGYLGEFSDSEFFGHIPECDHGD